MVELVLSNEWPFFLVFGSASLCVAVYFCSVCVVWSNGYTWIRPVIEMHLTWHGITRILLRSIKLLIHLKLMTSFDCNLLPLFVLISRVSWSWSFQRDLILEKPFQYTAVFMYLGWHALDICWNNLNDCPCRRHNLKVKLRSWAPW